MTVKKTKSKKMSNPNKTQALNKLTEKEQQLISQMNNWLNSDEKPSRLQKQNEKSIKCSDKTGNEIVDNDLMFAKLCNTYSTPDPTVAIQLLIQLSNVVGDTEDNCREINAAISLIDQIKPKDAVESMLANQMISIYLLQMECSRLALSKNRTVNSAKLHMSEVNKLSRTFIAQMEALNKHRGKGQQKMTVEHVYVNEGGQAIIGEVNTDKSSVTKDKPKHQAKGVKNNAG